MASAAGASPKSLDFNDAYSFDAIHHLYCECSMREVGIREFFAEGNIVPLTIVYEDFIQEYEKTVRKVLEFLELDTINAEIPSPSFGKTAGSISEEWVQRLGKIEAGEAKRYRSIYQVGSPRSGTVKDLTVEISGLYLPR